MTLQDQTLTQFIEQLDTTQTYLRVLAANQWEYGTVRDIEYRASLLAKSLLAQVHSEDLSNLAPDADEIEVDDLSDAVALSGELTVVTTEELLDETRTPHALQDGIVPPTESTTDHIPLDDGLESIHETLSQGDLTDESPEPDTTREIIPAGVDLITIKAPADEDAPADVFAENDGSEERAVSEPSIQDQTHSPQAAATLQINPETGTGQMVAQDEDDEILALDGAEDEDDDEDDDEEGSFRVEWDVEEEEEEEEEALEVPQSTQEETPEEEVVPVSIDEFISEAKKAADDGSIEKAVLLFSDVIDIDPQHTASRIARGRLYLDLGDYARSLSDFIKAEDISPDDPEVPVAIGDLYFSRKEYRKAIEYFDTALAHQADHAMALFRRGMSHYYRKDFQTALEDLQDAAKLNANLPNIDSFLTLAKKKARMRPTSGNSRRR